MTNITRTHIRKLAASQKSIGRNTLKLMAEIDALIGADGVARFKRMDMAEAVGCVEVKVSRSLGILVRAGVVERMHSRPAQHCMVRFTGGAE